MKKYINALIIFLLFPMCHYAGLKEDVVQLVYALEDLIKSLPPTSGIPGEMTQAKKELEIQKIFEGYRDAFENLNAQMDKGLTYETYRTYSKLMEEYEEKLNEIEHDHSFSENFYSKLIKEYDPSQYYEYEDKFKIELLLSYDDESDFSSFSKIRESIENNAIKFGVSEQVYPSLEDKLSQIIKKYLIILEPLINSVNAAKNIDKLDPKAHLQHFLELIDKIDQLKNLKSSELYKDVSIMLEKVNKIEAAAKDEESKKSD